jgi:hypothetical protein
MLKIEVTFSLMNKEIKKQCGKKTKKNFGNAMVDAFGIITSKTIT